MKRFFKRLVCKFKGHNYQFDKWEFYYRGHRRCQRCGQWED